MKKGKIMIMCVLLVFCFATTITAITLSTGKVTRLYVQECCGTLAPDAHFTVENRQLASNDCTNADNFFAVPLNTERGIMMYSLVLAAYMSGKSIHVYGEGTCNQTRPVFEDVHAVGFETE